MTLLENPFAVLGASPRDSRATLNEKADEAALLGGSEVDGALHQLMQLNRRISAELAWFPGAEPEAAAAFLDYARARENGQNAPLPPVGGLGCALSQANALAPFFARLPIDTPWMLIGLCRSLDRILSEVRLDETLQAINADRAAGGWEPVADTFSLTEPLNERLRELCAPLSQAVEQLAPGEAEGFLQKLFGDGVVDPQGSVAQAVYDAYAPRIHEEASRLRDSLAAELDRIGELEQPSHEDIDLLRSRVDAWCALTACVRAVPGSLRSDAKNLGSRMRSQLVDYFNHIERPTKSVSIELSTFRGTRKVTLEYKSQEALCQEAIALTEWLKERFPEQGELQSNLDDDLRQLRGMIEGEQQAIEAALEKARMRAGNEN